MHFVVARQLRADHLTVFTAGPTVTDPWIGVIPWVPWNGAISPATGRSAPIIIAYIIILFGEAVKAFFVNADLATFATEPAIGLAIDVMVLAVGVLWYRRRGWDCAPRGFAFMV